MRQQKGVTFLGDQLITHRLDGHQIIPFPRADDGCKQLDELHTIDDECLHDLGLIRLVKEILVVVVQQ